MACSPNIQQPATNGPYKSVLVTDKTIPRKRPNKLTWFRQAYYIYYS